MLKPDSRHDLVFLLDVDNTLPCGCSRKARLVS